MADSEIVSGRRVDDEWPTEHQDVGAAPGDSESSLDPFQMAAMELITRLSPTKKIRPSDVDFDRLKMAIMNGLLPDASSANRTSNCTLENGRQRPATPPEAAQQKSALGLSHRTQSMVRMASYASLADAMPPSCSQSSRGSRANSVAGRNSRACTPAQGAPLAKPAAVPSSHGGATLEERKVNKKLKERAERRRKLREIRQNEPVSQLGADEAELGTQLRLVYDSLLDEHSGAGRASSELLAAAATVFSRLWRSLAAFYARTTWCQSQTLLNALQNVKWHFTGSGTAPRSDRIEPACGLAARRVLLQSAAQLGDKYLSRDGDTSGDRRQLEYCVQCLLALAAVDDHSDDDVLATVQKLTRLVPLVSFLSPEPELVARFLDETLVDEMVDRCPRTLGNLFEQLDRDMPLELVAAAAGKVPPLQTNATQQQSFSAAAGGGATRGSTPVSQLSARRRSGSERATSPAASSAGSSVAAASTTTTQRQAPPQLRRGKQPAHSPPSQTAAPRASTSTAAAPSVSGKSAPPQRRKMVPRARRVPETPVHKQMAPSQRRRTAWLVRQQRGGLPVDKDDSLVDDSPVKRCSKIVTAAAAAKRSARRDSLARLVRATAQRRAKTVAKTSIEIFSQLASPTGSNGPLSPNTSMADCLFKELLSSGSSCAKTTPDGRRTRGTPEGGVKMPAARTPRKAAVKRNLNRMLDCSDGGSGALRSHSPAAKRARCAATSSRAVSPAARPDTSRMWDSLPGGAVDVYKTQMRRVRRGNRTSTAAAGASCSASEGRSPPSPTDEQNIFYGRGAARVNVFRQSEVEKAGCLVRVSPLNLRSTRRVTSQNGSTTAQRQKPVAKTPKNRAGKKVLSTSSDTTLHVAHYMLNLHNVNPGHPMSVRKLQLLCASGKPKPRSLKWASRGDRRKRALMVKKRRLDGRGRDEGDEDLQSSSSGSRLTSTVRSSGSAELAQCQSHTAVEGEERAESHQDSKHDGGEVAVAVVSDELPL